MDLVPQKAPKNPDSNDSSPKKVIQVFSSNSTRTDYSYSGVYTFYKDKQEGSNLNVKAGYKRWVARAETLCWI